MPTTGLLLKTGGRNTVLLGIAALVLMAVVGVSYREWRQYNRANADAADRRATADSFDRLLASLIDAETGQRGFLLTGQERYLEPYNRAIQEIPAELSTVSRLLETRPGQSGGAARLGRLTASKLAELKETIELRRTRGVAPALDIVLSDRGQQVLDAIRAIGSDIHREELAAESRASQASEAASAAALLVTIAGSLALLFLFAAGLKPFASPEPVAWQRWWPARYGAAVLGVLAIALLRAALTPVIGPTALPFTLFFCAIAFAAWFGGFWPTLLAIVLSLAAGTYFFGTPTGTFLLSDRGDQVAMLMLIVAGFGIALLSRAQRVTVDRALRAETAERNERRRFETTLAGIADAVLATDTNGRVTYLNPVAERLTGWPSDAAAGRPLEDVFRILHEESRQVAENPVAHVLRDVRAADLPNPRRLVARDGAELPIDYSAAPIRDARGGVTGVVLVFRDFTEREKVEERLRLSEAQFRQLADSMPQIIWTARPDGYLDYYNRRWYEFTGFPEGEFGQSSWEPILHPDDVARCVETYFGSVRAGRPYQIEYRFKDRSTGGYRWFMGRALPMRNESGEITRWFGTCTDVDDLKRTEEDLRRANEDLNQFAFAASHDLQEPLRMITSYSQLLLKGYRGQLEDEASTCVEFITAGTKRMRELLADLLAYTQVANNRRETVAPVDLNRVFQIALENCQAVIEETGATVTSGPLPAIEGQEPHFIQLLQNLIGNGLKYRAAGRRGLMFRRKSKAASGGSP